MGVVYAGRDPFIGRRVAIKTITTGLSENKDLTERFLREAQAAGGLNHPNIVTIFDAGEENGTQYIAMELLEGEDLAHLVAQEISGQAKVSSALKLGYIVKVCQALDYAHRNNIVHRDIKPGNIFIKSDGVVKVVDFGIARLTNTSSTSSGMLIGTIDYMSPEQIRGEKVDGRSDIWAVGVMTHEILTHQKPFLGSNITAVMFSIVSQEPKPLRELRPDLPAELESILKKMFRKDANERYQTMDELLSDIEPVWRRMQQENVGKLVTESESLAKSGDFQKARDLLKQALVIDTGHTHAKTLLEKISAEIRRGEVVPKLKEMVAAGQKLMQAGKFEEARAEIENALRIDSNFQPARELLSAVQKAAERNQAVQAGLRTTRQRMAEGSLTEAEQSVAQALALAPDNPEAQSLRRQIEEEKDRRNKRKRVSDGMQRARQLWTAQQFEEAGTLLEALSKEFPGEAEIAKLLETVRADQVQQEVQRGLTKARKHLGSQEFSESLAILDDLLQRYPQETAAQKLRELVLQERKEHANRLRLQRELQALKKLVSEEKYQDAIDVGEGLLKEFPDEFELARMVDYARSQKSQQQLQLRKQARILELQELIQANSFDKAIAACEDALKEFAGDTEFLRLLELSRSQQKEQKDRERGQLIEQRLRNIKQSMERGELTDAIDLGKRTIVQVGEDTDLTKLVQMAERERSSRDEKRVLNEQVQTAITMIESKKFVEATQVLRKVEETGIFDPRVDFLKKAAEEQRPLTRADLTLILNRPITPSAPSTAPSAPPPAGEVPAGVGSAGGQTTVQDVDQTMDVQPASGSPAGGETRIAVPQGAVTDFESTQKWAEPKVGAPPTAKEKPAADATRIFAPGEDEETARYHASAQAEAPPAAPATFNATTVMPVAPAETPRPKDKKGKKGKKDKGEGWRPQAWRGEEFVEEPEPSKPSPPPRAAPPASATTVMSAPRVEEAVKQPPTSATTIGQSPASATTIQRPSSATTIGQPPTSATTIGQPPTSATTFGQAPVAPPPRKPRVDERSGRERVVEEKPREEKRREEKREFISAAELVAEEIPREAKPFLKTGAGMAVMGVALAAVIGIGVFMMRPSTPAVNPVSNSSPGGTANTTGSATPSNSGGGGTAEVNPGSTTVIPTPSGPSPADDAKKLILSAKKMLGKGNAEGAKTELDKAEKLVKSENLSGNFPRQITDMRKSISDVENNKALAALIVQESQLWDTAEKALAANQFDQAESAYRQILGLGEGGLHKTDAQAELNKINVYKQEESLFPQAQAAAQKRGSVSDVDAAVQKLNEVANLHGRREPQARQLLGELAPVRSQLQAAESAANASASQKAKLDALMNDARNLLGGHKWDAADQKANEIASAGGDASALRGEIVRGRAADQMGASCTVGQKAHQAYDRPLSAGSDVGQGFLDAPLALNAGTNCGLATAFLQTMAKNSQIAILVNIDGNGAVVGGRGLPDDTPATQALIQAARQTWKFNSPKVNNISVKTSAAVTVHFK